MRHIANVFSNKARLVFRSVIDGISLIDLNMKVSGSKHDIYINELMRYFNKINLIELRTSDMNKRRKIVYITEKGYKVQLLFNYLDLVLEDKEIEVNKSDLWARLSETRRKNKQH